MKKVLLTGASGLIGAEVHRKLSASFEVLKVGRNAESDLKADFSEPETLKNLKFENCEAVIHCAGITDEDFKREPQKAFIQSTFGINALIQAAIENNVKRFIYISTSHIYGAQSGVIDENSAPNPLSDYAVAHFAAEQTLRRNAKNFENCFVLRPNAVFGTPVFLERFDRWTLIPYSFPLETVYHRKIVLRSTGEQNRNFVGTRDIADLIEKLLDFESDEKFSIINSLGAETISVFDFAERCAAVYRELTGEVCEIERPPTSPETKEIPFIYQTNYNFDLPKASLAGYIKSFIKLIITKYEHGKKYGA